jgi:hypothetical protein
MTNITGIKDINIKASVTFPAGFSVSQFADDTDPLDSASVEVQTTAMGANGDLIVWNSPKPIPATIAVIPKSNDDTNLGILLEANRKGKNKTIANDEITMTITYNDDSTTTLNGGAITSGILVNSSSSDNRLKSKPYGFMFENKV